MQVGFNDTGFDQAIVVMQGGQKIAVAQVMVMEASQIVVVGDISMAEGADAHAVYDFVVRVARGYADINGAQLRVPVAPKEKAAPKDDPLPPKDGDQTDSPKVDAPKAKGKKKRTVKKRPKTVSKGK